MEWRNRASSVETTVLLTAALFLLTQPPHIRAEDCTTGFSVVAPELAVPGKTTAVLVTLHGPASLQPLNVTIRLAPTSRDDPGKEAVETTQEIRGHGILPLFVPSDASGSYILQTLVNCSGSINMDVNTACNLKSSSQMRLVGPVRDVIIRPAKHAYRPGEIINFWVLALDHDLQIASGAIGTVSVKDHAGTRVALWDQVPLDEGVKAFTLPLSEYVRAGRWLLHVEVESSEFSAPIEVAPGAGDNLPDVSAAEEHYVELRFGKEMRRRYKPGLPFAGKVEAMSTEKSVRVRVKVYDNTTSIYSQDIEITNGEGTFVVPAILADSDVIALQAELVSVESKEIESHYVLAREPIQKWNSSSDCYLLIEGVEHTLQPEEEAHVAILSTCPCERDLHYVITTDGRVTDWAQRRYEDPVPPATSASTGAVCRLNFSFTVRSVMAPVSQLLVYYVTPQGEPVSDVISFDVKLLHRQVYVNLEEREWWLPGQPLDLEVVAEPSSMVCLLGGRLGGGNDIRFDPRISEEREPSTITGEVDFLEAGVSFFQRQCIKRGNSGISAVSYRQRGSGAGPSNRRRPPESLVGGAPFDQLWLWKCFNYTSEIASGGLTISAPQEAGKWSLWALTVSSSGLRFSSPATVQVFRPLQVEFRLPSSLRVRETLEVDIKIGNNINSCMDVTALLALSEGAQFLSNGLLYVTERLRLGPHGATSLVVRLLVTTPGLKNMTVEINGYSSPSCEGTDNSNNNTTLAGAVVKSATVRVHPEGIVTTDTESAYFCANEILAVSSNMMSEFEWIDVPRNRESFVVEIHGLRSFRSIPIRISLGRVHDEQNYLIVIGQYNDGKSVYLARGNTGYYPHLVSQEIPSILNSGFKTFWISWDDGKIEFGFGSKVRNDTILSWVRDKSMHIEKIGFAAGDNTVQFRIWNYNEESGFSQVLHMDTPRSVVPGSESGQLLVSGGLALPGVIKDLPQGGLTRALSSLTSLLAMHHVGPKANESLKQNALKNLPRTIQSILSYRKVDNSFSEHQMLSSHKATLSILEALVKVQSYFNVDPELIQEIKRWIQLRQEDDGSFTPLPADINLPSSFNDFTSSSSNSKKEEDELLLKRQTLETTAETLITLYEIGIENDDDGEVIDKAKVFLEGNVPNTKTSEIAVVTLALILVGSSEANYALEWLRRSASTADGEFGWPKSVPKLDAADWLYESSNSQTIHQPITATVEDYKASIYALMAFTAANDIRYAESACRFLFYRSHFLDNHLELLYPAVKAFTQFESLVKEKHRSLTISLATSGMELTDTLLLNMNRPSQVLHLPSLPTKVFVYATGSGCATVEGKTTYSTYMASKSNPLLNLSSKIIQEILPDRASVEEIEGKLPMLKIKTCFRWNSPSPSGVLRLEVNLFSGFELNGTPPTLLQDPKDNFADMEHGYNGNNLWFVFANVTNRCPICVQYLAKSNFVISSLRPAFAKIFPATREDLAADTFFHTHLGSSLLKGITDDDLITWFGNNSTAVNAEDFEIPSECQLDPKAHQKIQNKSADTEDTTEKSTNQSTTTKGSIEGSKDETDEANAKTIETKVITGEIKNQTKDNAKDNIGKTKDAIKKSRGNSSNKTFQVAANPPVIGNPFAVETSTVPTEVPTPTEATSEKPSTIVDKSTSFDEMVSSTPMTIPKIETLSVSTYTINVDGDSINNLTVIEADNGRPIIFPTAIVAEDVIPAKVNFSGKNYKDEIIYQGKSGELVFQGKSGDIVYREKSGKPKSSPVDIKSSGSVDVTSSSLTDVISSKPIESTLSSVDNTSSPPTETTSSIPIKKKTLTPVQNSTEINLSTTIIPNVTTVETATKPSHSDIVHKQLESIEENLIQGSNDGLNGKKIEVVKKTEEIKKKIARIEEKMIVKAISAGTTHSNGHYSSTEVPTTSTKTLPELIYQQSSNTAGIPTTPKPNPLSSTSLSPSSTSTSAPSLPTSIISLPSAEPLIPETHVSSPKHINMEKQEVPPRMMEKTSTEEDAPGTFAPEIKNDKYVLLDKEELWGMLKEVVHDEMSKKTQSKIIDGQRLRNQGFS